MDSPMPSLAPSDLPLIAKEARQLYAKKVADELSSSLPWWTAVIVTASSARQANSYRDEILRRQERSAIPSCAYYLTVPDVNDERIGSGGATLNALRALAEAMFPGSFGDSLSSWWESQRVLVIHSGGDSRRLPQYSLSGKLFSTLPVKTPWGDHSTVFDEFLALSTPWASRLPCGLVVASGDVLLTFDAAALRWDRPGVCGVAMVQPVEVGVQHGVYVIDESGRVYSFLQKPTVAKLRAAGGLLNSGMVGVDIGLLRFDVPTAASLMELAGVQVKGRQCEIGSGVLSQTETGLPYIDLYHHFTGALTGQWISTPDTSPTLRELTRLLHGKPFWCDLVHGEFTHVGTTQLFRQLMTQETSFSQLYQTQQQHGSFPPPGVKSAGVIVDSVFSAGGELAAGALVLECELQVPVRLGRGAILHGVTQLSRPLDVPDDTVIHPVPVALPDGTRGLAVRVYGVADDPKGNVHRGGATWFGRPIQEVFNDLGLDVDGVWPGVGPELRTLWNAQLFPVGAEDEVWDCARWMVGLPNNFNLKRWVELPKVSLASSTQWADSQALAVARNRRLQARWQTSAVALALAGSDVRPLLEQPPAVAALATTGRTLATEAQRLADFSPTRAASHHYQSHLFLSQAGLAQEAEVARRSAFACVQKAVDAAVYRDEFSGCELHWCHQKVEVSAPARCDFGGGWSDTPPFCLDWGGTVLNAALTIDGIHPIQTELRRLPEPVIRCWSKDSGETAEYESAEPILAPLEPGDPFNIPKAALRMTRIVQSGESLQARLSKAGGGLEIRTSVQLPIGSGLGTSSILSATLLRALAEMMDLNLSELRLSYQVLRLEQLMTTGGGWQDQIGGMFPGIKLIQSGPGFQQRLRIEPLTLSANRVQEFNSLFILYYTGIRRIAKDLLVQVVGRYLAREVEAVQVLHSIKTLASEMAYALREGEWGYLGSLMDLHWELNQKLDPNTTNSLIESLIGEVRPYVAGLKLAGAGGGGFLMLLAKDFQAAQLLRERLSKGDLPGSLHEFEIAREGLVVHKE